MFIGILLILLAHIVTYLFAILFAFSQCTSPIKYDKKALEVIGKKLKKNNVTLDIVDFGESDDSKPEKLEALLAAANNNDSSHIVHVPPGPNALSDVLLRQVWVIGLKYIPSICISIVWFTFKCSLFFNICSTPVISGDGNSGSGFAAAAAAASAVGTNAFDFGVDPNLDPELALALRVSMEEERARQEAAAKKAAEDADNQEKGNESASSSQDASMAEAVSNSTIAADHKMHDQTVCFLSLILFPWDCHFLYLLFWISTWLLFSLLLFCY